MAGGNQQAPAPRFSNASLDTFVQAVEDRREILFPSDGRRRPTCLSTLHEMRSPGCGSSIPKQLFSESPNQQQCWCQKKSQGGKISSVLVTQFKLFAFCFAAIGTQPVIHSPSDDLGLLVLVCESSGWYPAPSVTWENGLGENLTRYSHTELTNCTGGSVCVKSTLEMDNWPTGNYTCTMWDQELDEGLSSTFILIHRVPLGTVIGATGASVCAFILIVAVCWSWW
ncbi:butyrophilin-like protein 2 [Carcharodon carcharias]|uniref:butyrophilin-like protein 2 n=1 Tax=Carcharodon carcharias TaxID=13397 RepID=UPI001B7F3F4F|nr:butyrophilin-like protein 2 [Carcharodon carcharias]